MTVCYKLSGKNTYQSTVKFTTLFGMKIKDSLFNFLKFAFAMLKVSRNAFHGPF